MALKIGDFAPNFTADTTHGMINFYEWMSSSWTIFLSHPKNTAYGYTQVCTSELVWLSNNINEFTKRGVKLISLCADKLIQHSKWIEDIKQTYDANVAIPLIADKNMRVAKLYDMLQKSFIKKSIDTENNVQNKISSIMRTVYIISPDNKIASTMVYPVNTGRNFIEILRLLDSLMLTDTTDISTPVNWNNGEEYFVDDFANKDFMLNNGLNNSSEPSSIQVA